MRIAPRRVLWRAVAPGAVRLRVDDVAAETYEGGVLPQHVERHRSDRESNLDNAVLTVAVRRSLLTVSGDGASHDKCGREYEEHESTLHTPPDERVPSIQAGLGQSQSTSGGS